MQITLGMFLSVAYGANNGHTAMGSLAMLRSIHTAGEVPGAAAVSITLRCVSAVAMAIGTLFWGKRLAPITGQLLMASTDNAAMMFSSIMCDRRGSGA